MTDEPDPKSRTNGPLPPLWSERALLTMGVVLLALFVAANSGGLAALAAFLVLLAVAGRVVLVGIATGD